MPGNTNAITIPEPATSYQGQQRVMLVSVSGFHQCAVFSKRKKRKADELGVGSQDNLKLTITIEPDPAQRLRGQMKPGLRPQRPPRIKQIVNKPALIFTQSTGTVSVAVISFFFFFFGPRIWLPRPQPRAQVRSQPLSGWLPELLSNPSLNSAREAHPVTAKVITSQLLD